MKSLARKAVRLLSTTLLVTFVGAPYAANVNTTIQEGMVNINRTFQCGDSNDNATYQSGKININHTIQACGTNRNHTGQFGRSNLNRTCQYQGLQHARTQQWGANRKHKIRGRSDDRDRNDN